MSLLVKLGRARLLILWFQQLLLCTVYRIGDFDLALQRLPRCPGRTGLGNHGGLGCRTQVERCACPMSQLSTSMTSSEVDSLYPWMERSRHQACLPSLRRPPSPPVTAAFSFDKTKVVVSASSPDPGSPHVDHWSEVHRGAGKRHWASLIVARGLSLETGPPCSPIPVRPLRSSLSAKRQIEVAFWIPQDAGTARGSTQPTFQSPVDEQRPAAKLIELLLAIADYVAASDCRRSRTQDGKFSGLVRRIRSDEPVSVVLGVGI